MAWLLGGVLVAIGLAFLLRWYATTDPKKVLKTLTWSGLVFAVVVGIALLVTGRLNFLWVAAGGLLPWLIRAKAIAGLALWLRSILNYSKAARGPSGGRASTVNTRFIQMTLDHDTGEMDGGVREGPYSGRQLSDMTIEELADLILMTSHEDRQSTDVLEAYMDRRFGDAWKEHMAGPAGSAPSGSASMTVEEAYDILGLQPDASPRDIKAAHRRLMKQMHPDAGGSDYLAAKINEAKDLLLSGRH